MHPGIPVDAADLENITGFFQKGLEYRLAQGLHGLIKAVGVLLFVLQKPVTVVIHADSPEEIHGFRGKTGKHRRFSFQRRVMPDGCPTFCGFYR